MSGNQFPNSVTWHVITYSFLFTLGLLSKFHRLHLVFAFRELKKKKRYIMSPSLSQILHDFTNFYTIPPITSVPDWRFLIYLLSSYRSQFGSVTLLSTLAYCTFLERQWRELHMVFTVWGNRGFPQLKLCVLFSILCLILYNTTFGFLTAADYWDGVFVESSSDLLESHPWIATTLFFFFPLHSIAL